MTSASLNKTMKNVGVRRCMSCRSFKECVEFRVFWIFKIRLCESCISAALRLCRRGI
ncbi:MAG: hypothetical protein ACXQT6_01860 [Candidatus Methanospirareceae archaeon]